MTLQEDVWQGQYGEDLVRVLASAAGLTVARRSLDVDGIDFNLAYPGRLQGRGYPSIDVQVKSWKSPAFVGENLAYPLKVKNYNALVGRPPIDFPVSRLLFLAVVPETPDRYVGVCDEHYSLNRAVYWQSLMSRDRAPEESRTRTVHVPLKNLLTPSALIELLSRDLIAEAA